MKYWVTATYKGCRVAKMLVAADNERDAIRRAKMSIVNKFDKIRAELI